jgi:hypothetical protein
MLIHNDCNCRNNLLPVRSQIKALVGAQYIAPEIPLHLLALSKGAPQC